MITKLKELRLKHNMTQKELAEKLCKGESTISMWERGDREMDYETLKDISSLFNVSIDYLLGLTDENKEDRDTPFGLKESQVKEMIGDDLKLLETFKKLMSREDTALLFSKVKDLDAKTVRKVLKIIETITEEEEKEING